MSAKPTVLPSTPLVLNIPTFTVGSTWATVGLALMVDFLTLSLLFCITVFLRHFISPSEYQLSAYFSLFPYVISVLVVFWAQDLYPGFLLHPAEQMRRIFLSVTYVFLGMTLISFLMRSAEGYSRSVFLVTWVTGAPLVLFARMFIRVRFAESSWWGIPAVVLGSGPVAQRVARNLRQSKSGIRVAGVLSEEQVGAWAQDLPPLLGHPSKGPSLALSRVAKYAIIAMPQKANIELRRAIQDYCCGFRHVLLVPDLPGISGLGMLTREIGGEVGFELPQRLFHNGSAFLKRTIDILVSLILLLAFSPLLLAIAAAIKLTSKGPVFFKQHRYGKDGELFQALKFCSMMPAGEQVLAAHLEKYPESRIEWANTQKLKRDPRVTPIGKWLRRLSLDELPQFLNVLLGDMSLVGPRPIVASEIERYGRGYQLYTRVRPGITGLWQVSGRNNTTYPERVALDEYYVHNWSVWLDFYVAVKTIKVVLTAHGAY